MVMKPEPWGEALDAILGDAASDALLVVPSPAGAPFTQATARELAAEEHLVFAAAATRASTSASSTTTRERDAGCASSSASATTCSTAARSP